MSHSDLEAFMEATRAALSNLFVVNYDEIRDFDRGSYFLFYAKPSKRMRSILGVEREVLFVGNTYDEQQARTMAFIKNCFSTSQGRVEVRICFVVHRDPKGNSKLKNWGREAGITIIPIYAGSAGIPQGGALEHALANELFSHDPFDVTGPVASDSQFFGRRTEAQELARKLQMGQIRSCFGIRKIGKTSIMHRVLNEIENNFDCITAFVDCQQDSVFQLHAPSLLLSIAATIERLSESGQAVGDISIISKEFSMFDASKILLETIEKSKKPIIIAFDEVDYISPGSPSSKHWQTEFIEFWRNIRAAYQAALRNNQRLSILVCGVSSKWFSVESIDGVENAALAFVPEEYLSPLPRGAAVAMIRSVGTMAGLQFDESAADAIAACSSDMPFWIRKACSYIHERTETASRPLQMQRKDVEIQITNFVRDEGAVMAQVALQHLFRVYPDIFMDAVAVSQGRMTDVSPAVLRILNKYGLVNSNGRISGLMVDAGLKLVVESASGSRADSVQPVGDHHGRVVDLNINEWAEEIQAISRRRNVIERRVRDIAVNFVKFDSLRNKKSAKSVLLSALPENRRSALEKLGPDDAASKFTWLELSAVILKNWDLFEAIFGDKKKFEENRTIVNERPDAHAKTIDMADVALYRRSLLWFEERIDRI